MAFKELYNYEDETDILVRNQDIHRIYYSSIRNYPILTNDEVKYLFNEYRKGNKKAREDLINCHLRLAYKSAFKMLNRVTRLDINDLIQEANLLVIKAVDVYAKTNIEIDFIIYVSSQIKYGLYSIVWNNDRLYRLPGNYLQEYKKIKQAFEFVNKYRKKNEKIDLDRVAKVSGIKVDRIKTIMKHMQSEIYLESEIKNNNSKDGSTKCVKDVLKDPTSLSLYEMFIEKELKSNFKEAMTELPREDQITIIQNLNNVNLKTKTTQASFESFFNKKDKQKTFERAARKLRQNQKVSSYI